MMAHVLFSPSLLSAIPSHSGSPISTRGPMTHPQASAKRTRKRNPIIKLAIVKKPDGTNRVGRRNQERTYSNARCQGEYGDSGDCRVTVQQIEEPARRGPPVQQTKCRDHRRKCRTLTASRSAWRTCGDGCWQKASLWSSTPPRTMTGDPTAPPCGGASRPVNGRYSITRALSRPANGNEYWLRKSAHSSSREQRAADADGC